MEPTNTNSIPSKKVLIALVALSIVLIAAALYQNSINPPTPKNVTEITETGAVIQDGLTEQGQQMQKLVTMLPYQNTDFKIEVSDSLPKFKVQINGDFETNRAKFETWLQENGLGKISPVQFKFEKAV